MQVVTVGDRTNGRYATHANGRTTTRGRPCISCQRVLRSGDRVLRVDDYTFVHLPCLRETIGDDPAFLSESRVHEEFRALRTRLAEQYAVKPSD